MFQVLRCSDIDVPLAKMDNGGFQNRVKIRRISLITHIIHPFDRAPLHFLRR